MWQLVINGPGYFDTQYDLPEGTTHLGRADENDIVLSGDLVSRKHARIHTKGDALEVEDLGSRNGSKLNGEPLKGSRALKPGDTLLVGENSLLIRQPSTVESAATEMVDAGGGGAVKRFGRGLDIESAVILARDVRDSVVLRVLDNIAPFAAAPPPFDEGAPVPRKKSPLAQSAAELEKVNTEEIVVPAGGFEAASTANMSVQSLALLYRVAEALAQAHTLQEFLDDVTDRIMQRVGASTGVVLLRHRSGVLVPAAVRHQQKLKKGEVPVSDAVVDAALARGEAIAVADVRDDSRFAERDSVVLYGVDQVLCVPLGIQAPWTGVLYLNRPQDQSEPVEALLDIATAVAQLIHSGVTRFGELKPSDDHLRRAFERFHAPDIADRRAQELKARGGKVAQLEEKLVTVLFADIAGFTGLVGKLSPDRVGELLNELYERATRIIFSFEGTVDKFVGDAVMALFGAPYVKGDDALRAVRCALALKAEWERVVAKRPPRERSQLKIGINTGKVLAGTIGGAARLDFTAVGEPVNVASFLCTSAEAGQVLITGKTLAAIGARFDVTPLGERPLLGSRLRTSVFEVIEEDPGSGTLSGVR